MKFQRCSKDNVVYRKSSGKHTMVLAVYVDDLLVTRTSLKIIMEFKKAMQEIFEMTNLGKLT
jgi:hypothetical protein